MKKIGIYIHIPFCKRKCFYCHFVKYSYNEPLIEQYIHASIQEIKLRANTGYVVDTVYIGGGSPSLLLPGQLAAIMDSLSGNFNLAEDIEFTMELNPEDVTPQKLQSYKELGINRLSIGTQSFLDEDLHYLRRTHDGAQSLEAIETTLNRGFDNLNIDFIISLPTQSKKSLEQNFKLLQQYDIPHISAYILEEVEEGDRKNSRDHDLYFFTRRYLEGLGYRHYEVSNYSKPGFASKHNLKYWRNHEYIGIGLSASGFEKGVDYRNISQLKSYFKSIADGDLPHKETEKPDLNLRRVVMGLRLLEGIPKSCFETFDEPLTFLLSHGMLVSKGGNIAIHPDKMLLLNEILTYFF